MYLCPHCGAEGRKPGAPKRAQVRRAANWHVLGEDSEEYGPVSKDELDSWVADGSVTAGCQVFREGDDDWQWASDVYPELAEEYEEYEQADTGFAVQAAPRGGGGGSSDSPFGIDTSSTSSGSSGRGSSYSSYESSDDYGGRKRRKPHRGVLILVLSLLGFPFSIAAWVMGKGDLSEMDQGRMDPSGRGLTQAGMILGMIGTILVGIGLVLLLVIVAMA